MSKVIVPLSLKQLEDDKSQLIQLFIDNENSIQVLLDCAKKFIETNCESLLTIKICQKLHHLYDQKEKDNLEIKTIVDKENIWRSSIKSSELKDKTEEIEKYDLNMKFYGMLPESIKPNNEQFLLNISQVSMIMVKAAHFIYTDSTARLRTNIKDKMEIDEESVNNTKIEKATELFNQFNEILDSSIKDLPANLSIDIIKYLKEKNLPMICVRLCHTLAKKIQSNRIECQIDETPKSFDLDQILYQIIEYCVNSIFDTISKIEKKVKENGHLVTNQELEDLAILKKGEILKEFIEFLIPEYLKDPYSIVKLGQKLLGYEQYNHVVLLTELGRIRLENLKKEQQERLDLFSQIQKYKDDIESIKKVKGDTTLPESKLDSLNEQKKKYTVLPSYALIDKRELSKLNLEISTLRIKSILEMKRASKYTLNIQSHLDETLAILLDPQHIYELALLLKNTEVDTALVYGHRCQLFITDLEALREKTLPLQTQLDSLLAEESNLRKNGHALSEDLTTLIAKLKADISSLPAFPFFSTLSNRHEYDRLNLQVAQLMISCILTKKSLVDSKDQAQKDLLNAKVNELVNVCLEKFKDPKYLLELQVYLKNEKEDKILIQIANHVLNESVKIENLRLSTNKLVAEINNAKDDAEKSKLQQRLNALPALPYFSSNIDFQYDKTIYDSVDTLLHSLLDHYSFVEEKNRKGKLFSIKNIEEEGIQKEKDEINNLINQSVSHCLPFIKSPVSVHQLATSVSRKRDSLFLDIQKYLHPILVEKHKESIQYKKMEITVSVLNQELTELTKFKKEMPALDIQILENTKSSLGNISIPYISEYLDSHSLHSKLIIEGIKLFYDSLKELFSPQNPIPKNETANLIKLNQTHIDTEFELFAQYIENPDTFTSIINLLKERKEYKLITDIGKLAFDKLKIFREYQKVQKTLQDKQTTLDEEREQLNKQRRRLSAEKNEALRNSTIEQKVKLLDPPFYTKNVDDLSLYVGNLLVECNSKEKLEFETKASSKEMENQFQYIQTERKRINDLVQSNISLILSCIVSLEKLISFANDLFNKKEYNLVLKVGASIEDILDNKKIVIEEKEALLKESKELQSQFLQSKSTKERDAIQVLIDKNQKKADEVIPTHTYEEIKELTLKITSIMIESANFEDLGEILRQQYIIAFRIDTSPEKWDIIRNLSSEEEWNQTKNELVEYVMKKEENINSKIELLMKDGLFTQCIKIFPHPSTEEAELDIQLNLLISLYEAVDQYQFSLLNEVIPIVQRYCKRCYQEWKPEKLDPLYDCVQKRFPSEIRDIFEVATDMLLVNILQSQYPIFLGMLKSFKKRMVNTLGLDSLWNSYLDNFKKTHKSKKRLIQMISFIGDSVWNIEAPNNGTKAPGKRSTPASASTSQNNLKRIKVNLAQQKKDETVDEEFYEDTDEETN
ncbi:hypothetical protein DICPUDRAFT_37243 [Dictyostelium purpureum]|uniref:Uncharacterized protein n=1 Tax=Dictyostelium purpureum TaxID=5786 RepID=F0ZSF9_DICPU|nr:uncharacterized protein DICPUDRAFT_37243 [Dictyostelium purpureum]EGC33122.1 hypothetical protein DICPUDRAFT_37243 [Dictyostelium purpureum]|eukprot:XP_003290359.1 hypothetical protein DICPUDRAFT_37243 [Dictyostelium purpureum]